MLTARDNVGQVSPGSAINTSLPCVGEYQYLPPSYNNLFALFVYITSYTQADVDAIVNCMEFNGSIFIDRSFQGDVILPTLENLNGGLLAASNIPLAGNLTGLIFPKMLRPSTF